MQKGGLSGIMEKTGVLEVRKMAEVRQKKASALRGAILIVVLVAAVVLGALAVWKGYKASKWTRPESTASGEPAKSRAEQTPALPAEPASQPEISVAMEAEVEPVETVTLMALGDNLIHNTVYWSAETADGGYDFTPFYQDIQPVVEQYDIACINQETIFVKDHAMLSNYPAFGSPTEVGDALAETGFDVVTCATNHCYDKLDTGIRDTCSYWRDSHPEITVLGIHDSEEDARTLRVVEKSGIRIAMLNYTYGLNYSAPEQKWMVDQFSSFDRIAADLKQAEQDAEFTIVFAHWGEEGQTQPNRMQTTWAQFLADNGADLIIGGHPHLVQPLDMVTAEDGRRVPVFYSLGNFLSHQDQTRNMLGGMADVTLEKNADGVRITHCELKPTVNVILYAQEGDWYSYRPMLLEDYTDELAEQHRFSECTVDAMWGLFDSITGGKTVLK